MHIGKGLFYAIPLASAFCNMFLLLTFLSVKKDRLIRSFMWLLTAFTTWPLASFFMRISLFPGELFWCQVSVISVFCVPLLIYTFIHYYTGQRGNFLLWLFTLLTAALSVMNVFDLFMVNPRIEISASGQEMFLFDISPLAVLPVIFAVAVLVCAARSIYISVKKEGLSLSMFYPFFAGIVIMFAAILLDMVPGLSAVFPLDPFACMINAILIYFMLYRKRVFTLTQLASNGSTYLVSTVITAGLLLAGFSGLNNLFDRYFSEYAPYRTLITAIVSSVMTIVLFNLLKVLANNLFVKSAHDRELVLKEFSTAVSKTLNQDEILSLLTDLLREHAKNAVAYIFMEENGKYTIQSCTDKMRSTATVIDRRNPLIRWLRTHKEGIRLADFRHTANFKSMWESEKQSLAQLNADLFLPIICDDELIGLTVFSEKSTKKAHTYSEINFLESVISVVCIAMKNAQLYRVLQEEAHLDSLTNLYNRRYFVKEFDRIFAENRHNSLTLILINFDDFTLYNELYGSGDGDDVLQRFAGILKSTVGNRGLLGRYGGNEFSVCLPVCSSQAAQELVRILRQKLQKYLSSSGESTKKMLTFSAGICSYPGSASTAREIFTYANMAVYACKKSGKNKTIIYSQQHGRDSNRLSYAEMEAIGQKYAPTIYALTAAIDAKDHYTFSHSKNVSYLATRLAQEIGLDEAHVEMIRQAGLLHDIGKISVPESILTKTTALTEEEYKIMQGHVESSISMIRHLPSLEYIIPIAISHHERYDGRGYPRGLAGEDIPIGGRCLGIADAFDAIVSRRPYKDPIPVDVALREIERNLGKQFDPVLGRKFVDLVRSGVINVDFYKEAASSGKI